MVKSINYTHCDDRLNFRGNPSILGWSSENDFLFVVKFLDCIFIPDISNIVLHYLTELPPKGVPVQKFEIPTCNQMGIYANSNYLYVFAMSDIWKFDPDYLYTFGLHNQFVRKVMIKKSPKNREHFEHAPMMYDKNVIHICVHNDKLYHTNGFQEICINDIFSGELLGTILLSSFFDFNRLSNKFGAFALDTFEDKIYVLVRRIMQVFSLGGYCLETIDLSFCFKSPRLHMDTVSRKLYITDPRYSIETRVYDLCKKRMTKRNIKIDTACKQWLVVLNDNGDDNDGGNDGYELPSLDLYHTESNMDCMFSSTKLRLKSKRKPFSYGDSIRLCTNGIDTFILKHNYVWRIQ